MTPKNIDRREEILACFKRLVSKFGIDKTTMRDISQEMGLSVGTLYNDFKDKRELVSAMVHQEIDRFLILLKQQEEKAISYEDKLYVLTVVRVKILNEFAKDNHFLFKFILSEPRSIRYIGKAVINMREYAELEIQKRIENVLRDASQDGILHVANTHETANLLVDAFAAYYIPPFLQGSTFAKQEKERKIRQAEQMYNLFIKSMKQ